MKEFLLMCIYLTFPLASIISAGMLAFNDKDGWGWFLFLAFILCCGVKIKCN